jgi:hypothetical protein
VSVLHPANCSLLDCSLHCFHMPTMRAALSTSQSATVSLTHHSSLTATWALIVFSTSTIEKIFQPLGQPLNRLLTIFASPKSVSYTSRPSCILTRGTEVRCHTSTSWRNGFVSEGKRPRWISGREWSNRGWGMRLICSWEIRRRQEGSGHLSWEATWKLRCGETVGGRVRPREWREE